MTKTSFANFNSAQICQDDPYRLVIKIDIKPAGHGKRTQSSEVLVLSTFTGFGSIVCRSHR